MFFVFLEEKRLRSQGRFLRRPRLQDDTAWLEEKTPCADIVWVAGRAGKLPQIITSETNLMCGIQSTAIGTAAALEWSSKCYLLIHGMRTDTQSRRIDCAISSLCAVLTQWKREMRFNVVMRGLSVGPCDSHKISRMYLWQREWGPGLSETLPDIIERARWTECTKIETKGEREEREWERVQLLTLINILCNFISFQAVQF